MSVRGAISGEIKFGLLDRFYNCVEARTCSRILEFSSISFFVLTNDGGTFLNPKF